MRDITGFAVVLLCRSPVDMRRGLDGLRALAEASQPGGSRGPVVFAFVSRGRDKVKLLYWDRTGYALWYKRLERARFPWPDGDGEVLEISGELFSFLLSGVDIFVKPHDDFPLTSGAGSARPQAHDRGGSHLDRESRVAR